MPNPADHLCLTLGDPPDDSSALSPPCNGCPTSFTLYTLAILKTLQLIILCACGPLGLKNPLLFSSSVLLEITAQEEALLTGCVPHVCRCYRTHRVWELTFLFPWTETPWEQELSFKSTCLSRIWHSWPPQPAWSFFSPRPSWHHIPLVYLPLHWLLLLKLLGYNFSV